MSETPDMDDAELVRRITGGDEAAFTMAYRQCGPSVFRFALHMTGDRFAAEEITQEVFMKLISNPRGYDSNRGTLCAWLLGIARNLIRRRTAPGSQMEALHEAMLPDGSRDYIENLNRRETVEAVRQAISSLPAAYKEVIGLCDLEELDYSSAASILACPVGTVRSRLHRARQVLALKLQARCFV